MQQIFVKTEKKSERERERDEHHHSFNHDIEFLPK